jgi:hypothetical protein
MTGDGAAEPAIVTTTGDLAVVATTAEADRGDFNVVVGAEKT